MSSYNRILGFDRQTGSWQNVACNSTGALFVTGITSSGETSSNVTVLNQISGFATSAKQDSILSDLDQFKFTGDKLQVETISGFATSALQESSNTSQYGKLSIISDASEISSEYLQGILTKSTGLQHQSTKYTLDSVGQLAPDTNPTFTQPPNGSGLDGWYFKNVALSQPSQIYYYSYVNLNQQIPSRQKTYTIGDISGGYSVVNMLSVNATAGLVMLGIYSRPTGSGDTVPGFFKSRKVYTIPKAAELTQGMTVLLYWGVEPDSRLFPDVTRIECTLTSSVGPCLPTENLAFLTLNTDSGALVGNSEYIVSHAGWIYDEEHIHNTQFTAESDAAGDASAANQQLQLTQAQQSNTSVCARLDKNVYTSSNLHVRDDSLKASMESQFTNLNSVIGQGLYINMDSDPVVSGGVKLRGFSDGNLFVHDARTTGQLVDCVSQLSGINEVLNDLTDGTQQMYVTLSGADDSVSIMGFNESLSMPQSVTLTTSSGMRSLDVHVANQPSGYATETTLDDVKTQTDKLTYIDEEGNLGNLKVIDLALNTQLSQFSFFTNADTITDLRVKQMDPVDIRNATGESLNVTGSVSITADQSVAISGSVQTHCFASQNGTDWHYVDSDSQGRLNVNARNHDGSGNPITSTLVSGTETYTGLDVVCKGLVSVQNASGTQLQVIKANGATFSLYTGAISDAFLGSLDLDGYHSFDLLVLIPGGATITAGSLYMCISDNGTDWYFTTQSVYVNNDSNARRYTTTLSSLNSRYVCVTGANPYGGTGLVTTDSTIKVSAKK